MVWKSWTKQRQDLGGGDKSEARKENVRKWRSYARQASFRGDKKLIGAANSGKNNFWFGKTTTDKQKAAARKTAQERVWTAEERKVISDFASISVKVGDAVFSSQTVAAKHFNVSKSTIGHWVKLGKATIVGEPRKKNRRGGGLKGKDSNSACRVTIDGKMYDTITEAANAVGKSRNTITAWVKSGKATKLPKEPK